jgi:hypothetical protein
VTKRVEVEKVTATQVVLPGRIRFRKDRYNEGVLKTGGGSGHMRAVPATDENLQAAHEHDQEVRRAVKKQDREANRAQVEFDARHDIPAEFTDAEKEPLRRLGELIDSSQEDVDRTIRSLTNKKHCHNLDDVELEYETVATATGAANDLKRKFTDPDEALATEEIVKEVATVYARNILSRIGNGRNIVELRVAKRVLDALARHSTLEVEIW